MAKVATKKKEKAEKSERVARARQSAHSKVKTARSNSAVKQSELSKKDLAEMKQRNDLIDQYMPYAASIANRVCQTLSSAVEFDEVLCNARLGLLEAAKRFDPEQGVDFRTFAYYRIKGAIYDGLRRSGWLPRTLYSKIKFEEAANEYMQNRALHVDEEKVKELPPGYEKKDAARETIGGLTSMYIVSIDASEDLEIVDENSEDMESKAEFMQVRRHMRDSIGSLPEKEKQLVMMYYFQSKTLEEIGDKLGLSKSWTSRLHARALALLFKRIKQKAHTNRDADNEGVEELGDVNYDC